MQFFRSASNGAKALLRHRNILPNFKFESLKKFNFSSTNYLPKATIDQAAQLKVKAPLVFIRARTSKFNQPLVLQKNFGKRNFVTFYKREEPKEEPQGEEPKGDDYYKQEEKKKSRFRWTFFGLHRVPEGTEMDRFGTWNAVKEPITSWPRIRSVVGGTIFFMALIEIISIWMELNLTNMLNTFENVEEMEKEGDTQFRKDYLWYLSFLPWFAAVMPVTFDKSKFYPMLFDMLKSKDTELQWFAIRSFSSATTSEDLRHWAIKLPIDEIISIIETTFSESAKVLHKYQKPYRLRNPKTALLLAIQKTPEEVTNQLSQLENIRSKLDEVKKIHDLREEQVKKFEDALFLIQSLAQYSSTIPTLVKGGTVDFLLKIANMQVGSAPEDTQLRELSEDLMTKYFTLDSFVKRVVEDAEKRNPPAEGVVMLKDGEEKKVDEDNIESRKKAVMNDPTVEKYLKMTESAKATLDDYASKTNYTIGYSDQLDGNLKKMRAMAAKTLPNLARLASARKAMLQHETPLALVELIRTTDDPEVAEACGETLGNMLEHDAEDIEFHNALRAQIKAPFGDKIFTDEDIETFAKARTNLTKLHQTGWQIRLAEMTSVGVFGYFYARARWAFFLKYIQKIKDKKIRKHIGKFRSPHGALMSIFMMYPVDHLISHHLFEKDSMKQKMMRYVNEFLTFNVFVFAILVAPYCIIPSILGGGIALLFFHNTDNYEDDYAKHPHLFKIEDHADKDKDKNKKH